MLCWLQPRHCKRLDGPWTVVGFCTKEEVLRSVHNHEWLKRSVLVEWQTVEDKPRGVLSGTSVSVTTVVATSSSTLQTSIKNTIQAQCDSNLNPASRNLHVSGYGRETTVDDIRDLFAKYVDVVNVVRQWNFMFVNTSDLKGAIKARLALSGTMVHGSPLKINYAKGYY